MASLPEPIELEGWALRSIANSVCRELPDFKGKAAAAKVITVAQKYFRIYRILEVSAPQCRPVYIAYRPDNTTIVHLSGKQEALRLVASIDPVPFRSAEDVLEFATFADRITTDDLEPPIPISAADEIEKVLKPANGERDIVSAVQEQFRELIQPPAKFMVPYGIRERFFLIRNTDLISRTWTIASGGIFWRQDEVLFGELPLPKI